ncbi:hypothetical protein CVD28_01660 [Bacillus sp. M6-12]|uniref:DUF6557 family protein n=1 Tax=Bacillus sp. M6-12 TaxID=2054166 RepID=UPI000C7865F1|nr:DUF6557 family protein [Bacillus sp. M6-12]PLS19140.1 hypothetical protein CVD28_01660 [Bacillus sp. M6-12]
MILKEILADVNIEGVENALRKFYFHQNDFHQQSYKELLEQLKNVPLTPLKNHMTLHVEFTEDCGSNECIWSATYSLYRRYKRKYSLEFANIEQIANASVREEEVTSKEEYMAHVLWEYLYNQYSEEEESKFHAEEKKRRQMNKTEYCSIEDVLNSLDEEVFDED